MGPCVGIGLGKVDGAADGEGLGTGVGAVDGIGVGPHGKVPGKVLKVETQASAQASCAHLASSSHCDKQKACASSWQLHANIPSQPQALP